MKPDDLDPARGVLYSAVFGMVLALVVIWVFWR